LALRDAFSRFVFAHMSTMTGEKDGRIGIQETSDSRVQHRREIVTNGLMCQTKYFAGSAVALGPVGKPRSLPGATCGFRRSRKVRLCQTAG
jgi:hypothetical protein